MITRHNNFPLLSKTTKKLNRSEIPHFKGPKIISHPQNMYLLLNKINKQLSSNQTLSNNLREN